MRVSREVAELNHQKVIDTASQLFREHGFDGIGVKDLMKEAGFTQGGFYKRFASKDDLAAQAAKRAMETSTRRWVDTIASHPDAPLEAIISFYLSPEHRTEKRLGCPLAALSGDAARQDETIKASFEGGVRAQAELLHELLSDGKEDAYGRALAVLSLLVGALTLSRSVNDETLASDLLASAGKQVRKIGMSGSAQ